MVEGSIIQALEIGIVQIHAGMDLEEVLALFPEFSVELRAPLEAAQAARWLAVSTIVTQNVEQDSRERFVQAVGTTRMRMQGGRRRPRTSLASPAGRRISARSSAYRVVGILAVLIALVLGLAAAVMISSRALPGEPLYPLKQAGERAQLWFQRDPARRLELEKNFDSRRNQEVQSLIVRIRAGEALAPLPVQWIGELQETLPGIWKVQDLNVSLLPETQLVGQVIPGYVVVVDGQLQADGTLSADRIAIRQFQVRGRLDRAGSAGWVSGGVPFTVTEDTIIEGQAIPGSQVLLILVEKEAGELVARLIQVVQP